MIKKLNYLFIFLLGLFITIRVNALVLNEKGVFINSKGAIISIDQYNNLINKYDEKLIDILEQEYVDMYSKLDIVFSEKYIITTYKLDVFGNVIEQYDMEATKEQAEAAASNEDLMVSRNGQLISKSKNRDTNDPTFVVYQTNSKRIQGEYHKYNGTYYINQYVIWLNLPSIRKYDVFAARWTNSNTASYFYGKQSCDSNTGVSNYYLTTSPNVKSTSYGLGVTMDLHDSAQTYIDLEYHVSSTSSFGQTVYGTYQHAKNSNITMNGSLSYTFSSSGLGGVLYYSNATTRSYYDGMQGITMNLQ